MTAGTRRRHRSAASMAGLMSLALCMCITLMGRNSEADAHGARASWGVLPRSPAPAVAGVVQDDLPPVAYLPVAFNGWSREPHWSGTARFGFGAAAHPAEWYNVSRLNADWYLQYPGFRTDPGPGGLEYAQIVRLKDEFEPPEPEAIVSYARAHPGTLWLIGNEPDAPAQDCATPSEYAVLYHDFYTLIKGADPTAKLAIGGVVQATPLRLRYLDKILEEYDTRYGCKIPVDVWNVHGFILRERIDSWGCQIPCGLSAQQGMLYGIDDHDDMSIFRAQIERFRQWMKENGERNKPLIVSEYGILFPIQLDYDESRVEQFMIATFDYFRSATSGALGYPEDGNRLVQAWCWYSLDHSSFEGYDSYSHLFDPDTMLITPLGRAYGNYTSSLP